MARYRKIDVRMWGDAKFRALSALQPGGQALWIYLLTGPHTTNVPGLYAVGPMSLAERLGWPVKGIRDAISHAITLGMMEADLDAPLIWIPRAIHYNKPTSINQVKGWQATWDELPECDLKLKAYQELKAFLDGMGDGFVKAYAMACAMPCAMARGTQEQEQEQEKSASASADRRDDILEAVELYHSLCPSLPRVQKITSKRRAKWRSRSHEAGWMETFAQACAELQASDFAREGSWATFDWLIENDTNAIKAVEGKYRPRGGQNSTGEWAAR